MSRWSTLVSWGFVIVVLISLSLFLQESTLTTPALSSPSKPQSSTSTAPASAKVTADQADQTRRNTAQASQTLGLEFYRSTNMRDFMHKSRLHPEQGGLYYAYRGLMECAGRSQFVRQPQYDGKGDTKKFARQQDVATQNQLRCANLLASDWSDDNLQLAKAELEQSHDLLYRWEQQFKLAQQQKDGKLMRELIQQWLELEDPALILDQGMAILSSQGQPRAYWFAGKDYRSVDDIQELTAATDLVACEIAGNCGPYSLWWTSHCLRDNTCYEDWFDAYQHIYHQPGKYQRIYVIYQQMLNAIQRKDLDAFINPAMPKFKAATK